MEKLKGGTIPAVTGDILDLEEGEIEGEDSAAEGRNHLREKDNGCWFHPNHSKEITFFVSKFSDGSTKVDLKVAFANYGEVTDVYIASKKDNYGRNFAFVRFANVVDVASLELTLKNLKFGVSNLFVKIARFDRGGKKVDVPGLVADKPAMSSKSTGVHSPVPSGVKSYRDAVINNNSMSSISPVLLPSQELYACNSWTLGSLLGTVLDVPSLARLNDMVVKGGMQAPVVRYVTGLKVLISFPCASDADDFLKDKNRWSLWFSSIEVWKGQVFTHERVAWIRIFGVPLHLWDSSVFNLIGERFGKVVHGSQASISDGNLASDCIGVLLNFGRKFSDEVPIRWKDHSFTVWAIEEDGQWVPDFLGDGNTPAIVKTEGLTSEVEADTSVRDVISHPLQPSLELTIGGKYVSESSGKHPFGFSDSSSAGISGGSLENEKSPVYLGTPFSGKVASGMNFLKFSASNSSLKRVCSRSRSPNIVGSGQMFQFPLGLSSRKRARLGDGSLGLDLALGLDFGQSVMQSPPAQRTVDIFDGNNSKLEVDNHKPVSNVGKNIFSSKGPRVFKAKRKVTNKSFNARALRRGSNAPNAKMVKVHPDYPP